MNTQLKSKFNPSLFLPSFNSFTILKEQPNSISKPRMLRHRNFNLSLYHHHQHRIQFIQHQYNPNFNRNSRNLQFIKPAIFARGTSMAENEKRENHPPSAVEKTEEREKIEVKKEVQPPLPPEKPLPGDCCGSGCVRCVWDIYYDELDDYDKLLKDFNSSK